MELWKYCNISIAPLIKVWLQLCRNLWSSELRNSNFVEFCPDLFRNMVSKDRQKFMYVLQQSVILRTNFHETRFL
jgi:hypothetical protein